MNIPIIYEKVNEDGFSGYYYAHLPTLGLTTHDANKDDAKLAAIDLAKSWIEEKSSNNEVLNQNEFEYEQLEI